MKPKNDFVKSVSILLTGTVLAQVISLLFTPIISRFFGPEENAYLGLFLRVTTLVATLSTARLDMVIPLERNKNYAFGIYQFSFLLSTLISFLCLLVLIVYITFTEQNFENILFLISLPLGFLFISFFNLGNSWELRAENYKSISFASIILSLSSNSFKLIGGIFSGHYLILIGATLLGYFLASIGFLSKFLGEKKTKILSFKSSRTKVLVKQNQDFYTYNLFHVILDLSRDMLIASFIWIHFSKLDFGSYEFSFRMMKLPIVFLATALSQVFFRKAKDLIQKPKELKEMTLKTLFYSFLIGIIPFGILFFFGQEIFGFVFGEKWIDAGKIAELISPWLFVNFVFTPISFIPILLGKQKSYFWINVGFLVLIVLFCFIFYYFEINYYDFILSFALIQSLLLFILILWFAFLIKKINI
ncbi:MAG: lipopolysaccharide biosynthesis protein [Bacteroidota bacterium]